jgi:hypothetical protein
MINIKKKPNKTYIEIYNYKTKKKIVTLVFSKESLKFANHIHKYFKHFTKYIFIGDWDPEYHIQFQHIFPIDDMKIKITYPEKYTFNFIKKSKETNKIFNYLFKKHPKIIKDIKVIPKYKK